MKALKEFIIPFVGLKIGKHHFEYKVEQTFFEYFEYEDFNDANVKVDVNLLKNTTLLELNFKISGTVNINCDITNNTSNVNNMLDTFMNYFLDQGFKNAYNNSDPFIVRTGSGGDNVLGRLRLDETECTSGSSNKQIALRAKTHKETKFVIITPVGWC